MYDAFCPVARGLSALLPGQRMTHSASWPCCQRSAEGGLTSLVDCPLKETPGCWWVSTVVFGDACCDVRGTPPLMILLEMSRSQTEWASTPESRPPLRPSISFFLGGLPDVEGFDQNHPASLGVERDGSTEAEVTPSDRFRSSWKTSWRHHERQAEVTTKNRQRSPRSLGLGHHERDRLRSPRERLMSPREIQAEVNMRDRLRSPRDRLRSPWERQAEVTTRETGWSRH